MSTAPHKDLTSKDTPQPPDSASTYIHPVDARLAHIFKDILPTAPYLLRLNPGALQAPSSSYSWRRDTHFEASEEELQYLTFRRDHEGTFLHAHGQWDDGHGNIAPLGDSMSRTSSGHTPLLGRAPKRKITLADYHNRDKSKTKMATKGSPAADIPIKAKAPESAETTTDTKKVNDTDAAVNKSNAPAKPATENTLKRPSEAITAPVTTQKAGGSPPKKARTSADPKSAVSSAIAKPKQEAKDASRATKSVPDSFAKKEKAADPSLESKKTSRAPEPLTQSNGALFGLPAMISPTLPAQVESELAALSELDRERLMKTVSHSGRLSHGTPEAGPADKTPSKIAASKPSPKGRSSTPEPRPSSQKPRDKQVTSAPRPKTDPVTPQSTGKDDPSRTSKKESLILGLKIKSKSNRKQLSQYLKLKPTPKKDIVRQHAKESGHNSESESGVRHVKPTKRESGSNDDESEPLAKRRKVLGWLPQKTQTPSANQPTTPASSRPTSAQKNHLATPLNGLNGTNMHRVGSQESAKTPLRASREPTPHVANKGDSPKQREWKKECRTEVNKYLQLATEIKHDSDKYLKTKGQTYEDGRKLGVVIATEAVLCFILAAMISDEPSRVASQSGNPELWKSTRGFINSLAVAHARPYRHLYGFLYQTEGLVLDTLKYQLDIVIDSVFHEYAYPTTGTADESKTAADETLALRRYHELLRDLHNTSVKSRTAWREGEAVLYHTELAAKFPETWKKQRDFPGRGKGRDPVYLHEYAKGGFALPMGMNTSGLEAVNFGLAFLDEYCKKENLEWKPKLVL